MYVSTKEWDRNRLENMRLRLRNERLVKLLQECLDNDWFDSRRIGVISNWVTRVAEEINK